MITMHVNLAGFPDAPKVIAGMLRAIRWTLAEQDQATVGEIRRYNRGKGPFDVSEHRLGVRTNRWRNSVRATIPRIVGTAVVASIGSNVEYAGAHEFGFRGSVSVTAHSRRQRSRNVSRTGRLGVKDKSAVALGFASIKTFTRQANVPARAPITYGIEQRKAQYEKAMSNSIIKALRGLN